MRIITTFCSAYTQCQLTVRGGWPAGLTRYVWTCPTPLWTFTHFSSSTPPPPGCWREEEMRAFMKLTPEWCAGVREWLWMNSYTGTWTRHAASLPFPSEIARSTQVWNVKYVIQHAAHRNFLTFLHRVGIRTGMRVGTLEIVLDLCREREETGRNTFKWGNASFTFYVFENLFLKRKKKTRHMFNIKLLYCMWFMLQSKHTFEYCQKVTLTSFKNIFNPNI